MARLSETAQRIRPGVFAELQKRIDAHAATGGKLVPLHIGDTHLAPPDPRAFATALEPDASSAELYGYGATAGLQSLRDAIAAHLSTRGMGGVDGTRHVHVGSGATHAIYCAARAILDPGDEVLLASPYWPLASGILHACAARPVEVELTTKLYDDPSIDPASLFAPHVTPRTTAIYLITPNNPDGKVLSRAQIESLVAFAEEHDLWILADEAYADMAFDAPHVCIASVGNARARTITARTFSKSHALAGARVGYVVAPEEVISAARRVSVHTVFNVSVAMQRAALAALRDGDAWQREARAKYAAARDATAKALEGSGLTFPLAEGGAYLFVDFAPVLGGRPLSIALERAIDHGVLLAPGDAFGRGHETRARLCYTSVTREVLLDGIAKLRGAIDSL